MQHDVPRDGRNTVYCADGQDEMALGSLMVRANGDPYELVASIREEIRAMDPGVPLTRVATLEDVVWHELSPWRYEWAVTSKRGVPR